MRKRIFSFILLVTMILTLSSQAMAVTKKGIDFGKAKVDYSKSYSDTYTDIFVLRVV